MKKKADGLGQLLVPQGGFEPPQSEPESEVLPLHNRGMQCKNEYIDFRKKCQVSKVEIFKNCLFKKPNLFADKEVKKSF